MYVAVGTGIALVDPDKGTFQRISQPDDAVTGIRSSSEPYALLKARTIRARLGATWGLAETGAAGPTGNRYGDAPGHSCIAITGPVERAITLAKSGDHVRATTEAAAFALQENLTSVDVYNVACVFSLSSAAARRDARLSPEDRAVVFAVADTGMGIALEDQDRIFQAFGQLDNPMRITQMRKQVARIFTVMRERELEAHEGVGEAAAAEEA